MNIIVFEDDSVRQLFPITTGRPAYAISCGSYRLADWLSGFDGNLMGLVRPYLETLQLHNFPGFQSQLNLASEQTWLINARLVPSVSNIKQLLEFKDRAKRNPESRAKSIVEMQRGAVTSAWVPTHAVSGKTCDQIRSFINGLADPTAANVISLSVDSDLQLFEYPHDVIDQQIKTLSENLAHRVDLGDFQQPACGVFCGNGVVTGSHVVFDTSVGPIVIDANVQLGPFSYLRGPIYIGPNSRICEHASVKDHVAVGHTCKIGGELEGSVVESFTNKQHHGFLGHCYLGSWVNLGAGTCNSDLKNTYGTVNVHYGDRKVNSGMQFLGSVIGDYAKTAINTSIFTGKLIGACSAVYGFATTNVPSFVNYARSFNAIGTHPPEVVVATQRRMYARRNVPQRPCDIQLIHDMYRVTASERPEDLSDQPLEL